MQKISKLSTFQPLIMGGVQETYSNSNGLYYKFVVGWENGDVGNALSSSQSPTWKIGDKYSYECTSREHGGRTFLSFSKLSKVKEPDANSSTSSYHAKTKEEWHAHAMQIAVECTSNLFKYNTTLALDFNQRTIIIDHFHKWIINVINGSDAKYWNAFNALRSAINFTVSPGSNITKTAGIVMLANELFAKCDVVENTAQVPQTPPQQPEPKAAPMQQAIPPMEKFIQPTQSNQPEYPEDTDELPF